MINKNEKCNNHYRKYYCAVSSFKFVKRKKNSFDKYSFHFH